MLFRHMQILNICRSDSSWVANTYCILASKIMKTLKKHTTLKVYRAVKRLLVHIVARLLVEIILRWFAILEYLDTNRFSFDQVGRNKRITPLYHKTYTSALPLLINLNIGKNSYRSSSTYKFRIPNLDHTIFSICFKFFRIRRVKKLLITRLIWNSYLFIFFTFMATC